jgi:predicted cobalt transporter CbtA
MLQTLVHYTLHLLVPGLIAYIFFRKEWKKAWLIMLATMLVDLDHLFATPIFDPGRCSINFHPLHTYWAMAGYVVLLFFRKTRIIAVGLLFHMFTDYIDCQWN